MGWGGGRTQRVREKKKKGSAKPGVTNLLPGNLQRGRNFGREPRTLVPSVGVYLLQQGEIKGEQ